MASSRTTCTWTSTRNLIDLDWIDQVVNGITDEEIEDRLQRLLARLAEDPVAGRVARAGQPARLPCPLSPPVKASAFPARCYRTAARRPRKGDWACY